MDEHPEYTKLLKLYERAARRCRRARTRKKRRHAAQYVAKLHMRIRAYERKHELLEINFAYLTADYDLVFVHNSGAFVTYNIN